MKYFNSYFLLEINSTLSLNQLGSKDIKLQFYNYTLNPQLHVRHC